MKRALQLSCEVTQCDFPLKVYSENSILVCASCKRTICVHCAAGLPDEINSTKTEEMIQGYKSVGSKFECHECTVLKRQKKISQTVAWGVNSFFSTQPCTDLQKQEAETYSFSTLVRRIFPNGSSAIATALDSDANAVCGIGNYGSAIGTTSKFRVLKRQPNSFSFNKEDHDELDEIFNAQLNCDALPHRILLLLPYVPFSISKECTGSLSPREIMSLRQVLNMQILQQLFNWICIHESLLAAHFCEFPGRSSIVIELVNGITGRALRLQFLKALFALCSLFQIRLLLDEALTGYRCSADLHVPSLGLIEAEEMIASDTELNLSAEMWLRSWSWPERDASEDSFRQPSMVSKAPADDSSYQGAVNASLFEEYFQLMKRHFGDSFEYESTVDFFAKTGSVMVLSKGVGAGHLLSADSRETLRESKYFPSMPNLSDQVERGADMALVNFHQTCLSGKQKDPLLCLDTSRPKRGVPTHGSQIQGMAFLYDRNNTSLSDTERSPGRTFYSFSSKSWDSLNQTGSIHTAVENIDKMEKILTRTYSPPHVEQVGSPFSKRIRLRLHTLLCEQGTGFLKTFKNRPFSRNIEDLMPEGGPTIGCGRKSSIGQKECEEVFTNITETRKRVPNSETRERQYEITGFKTNRPDLPDINVFSIRSILLL